MTETTHQIQGAGGKGSGGGGNTHVPTESRDTLRSKQIAHVIDLVSEGEIEGFSGDALQRIYLDDTPIRNPDGSLNLSDITLQYRSGTPLQEPVSGYGFDTAYEAPVAVELKYDKPVVRTLGNENTTALRVTLSVPQLTYQNPETGDLSGSSVEFRIETQSAGGGFVTRVQDTIAGKTTSRYQRAYTMPLTGPAPWAVRVTRLTPDSTQANLRNPLFWESYTGIIGAQLRYPNSALIAISTDAEQFRSIPTRAYQLRGLRIKVPSNYDPAARSYTGLWDGRFKIAWSDNPAWCFYDLVTNDRYGLGRFIDEALVDKWTLYAVGQYCDERVPDGFGGWGPRFSCNLYLQRAEQAWSVLQHFASMFRAVLIWSTGVVSVAQDRPSDALALFTRANVIDGLFQYEGASLKSRHTVALVAWNDPADAYRQKIEYVADEAAIRQYGVVQTELVAFGCTSRGQAHRAGLWLLYAEQHETETVTFRTGLEGFSLYPGAVFKTTDPNRAGRRMGGRIRAATATEVTLDDAVELDAGQAYTLNLILPDGRIHSAALAMPPGPSAVLTLAEPLPQVPLPDAIWTLSADDLIPESWRLVAAVEVEKGLVEVTGLAYRPDKYDAVEKGLTLMPLPTSTLHRAPDPVTDLHVTESLYRMAGSTFGVRATVSWHGQAARYRVKWRKTQGAWEARESVSASVDIDHLEEAEYAFSVTAFNVLGRASLPVTVIRTLLGRRRPPQAVTGFAYVIEPYGVKLTWDKSPEIDVALYEVREGGAQWEDAKPVGSIQGTVLKLPALAAGEHLFRIKAVNAVGLMSGEDAILVFTITPPKVAELQAALVGENIVLTWTPAEGPFAIRHYALRYGGDWANGTAIAAPLSTQFQEKVTFGGARTYWVAPVDVAGNEGAPASVTVVVQPPSAVTIRAEVIDNNILLRWSKAEASLPIEHYEIRVGASWAVSEPVGTAGNGRFTTFFVQAAGTYTYWIAGIDSAGNLGEPASVNATMSQPPDYVLRYDTHSDFADATLSHIYLEDQQLYAPISEESWQQHFESRGWSSPQDQIDAGFPRYFEPAAQTASYEEVLDYGAVQPATTVSATLSSHALFGQVPVTPTISVRATEDDPWRDAPGQAQTFAAEFRYVKIHYDFAASDAHSLIQISDLNLKLAVKHKVDSGKGQAHADEPHGAWVAFNLTFIDVQGAPNVQPMLRAPTYAVVDFKDEPYPKGFYVLLYDIRGRRISGPFSWMARGV